MAEATADPMPPQADPHANAGLAMLRGISREGRYVAGLTLLAAILRISFLDAKSLWMDEGMTACRVGSGLRNLVSILLHAEMNMCAYYLMMHAWIAHAGNSEFVLRLPSVVFDTATVPMVYLLGKELGSRRAGLIAALMLTLNATSIEYAQTARSYAMLILLSTSAWVFFVRGLRDPSPGNLAGYIASGGATVYAHLFGIFALPTQALILLWKHPAPKTARRILLAMIGIGLLDLPAFYFGITGYHGNIAWVPSVRPGSILHLLTFLAGAFDEQVGALPGALTVLYVIGILLAIGARDRAEQNSVKLLLIALVSPIAMVLAISIARSIFVLRYLLELLPLYVLLAALGLAQLKSRRAGVVVGAVVVLSATGVFNYYRAPSRQDWRGATDFIATHSKPTDLWIMYPDSSGCLFNYYHSRYSMIFPWDFLQKEPDKNIDPVVRRLSGITPDGRCRRVWLTYPTSDPLDISSLRPAFAAGKIVETALPGIRVVLFEPR